MSRSMNHWSTYAFIVFWAACVGAISYAYFTRTCKPERWMLLDKVRRCRSENEGAIQTIVDTKHGYQVRCTCPRLEVGK